MLYKLEANHSELRPLPFHDLSYYQLKEKDLENLLETHLFETLFEGTRLVPFHQERSFQPEGDLYALNVEGDVVIFELKLYSAGDDALAQLLRYTEKAGQWGYLDIQAKYRKHIGSDGEEQDLAQAHKDAFDLSEPLQPEQFNRTQHMLVVGNAADEALVRAVDFWRRKGLLIDFCPYRIYEIAGDPYFEFFAKPYDGHINPGSIKGVLFDTNRTYHPTALQEMIEKSRISAYGDRKDAVHSLSRGDTVFYSHKWVGLVAAARVTGSRVKSDHSYKYDELYWDVDFLTPTPSQFDSFPNAMSFQQVKEVTQKNFFWARTQKVPYLTAEEAEHLLGELKECLGAQSEPGETA